MEDKRAALAQSTQGTGIEVARTSDNQLKVNVPSDVSFDTGRSDIKPQMRQVLDQFAQGVDATMQVRVVGHTDSTGSDAINDPLSVARAESVRSYLQSRGIAGNRVAAIGRGEHEPIADNSTEAGRAKNRRVEIFLTEPQAAFLSDSADGVGMGRAGWAARRQRLSAPAATARSSFRRLRARRSAPRRHGWPRSA